MLEENPTTLNGLRDFLQSHVPFTKELSLLAELRTAEEMINSKLRSRGSLTQMQEGDEDLLGKREGLGEEGREQEEMKEDVYAVKRIQRVGNDKVREEGADSKISIRSTGISCWIDIYMFVLLLNS